MKKTLVALAALAATASFAQSSVTLYGTLDASYSSGTAGGSTVNKVGDSLISSSVWGLRGSEDLGGGLKAIFNAESDVSIETGATKAENFGNNASGTGAAPYSSEALFRRAANVGLQGGFGEITLGRRISPAILNGSSIAVLGGNIVSTQNHRVQGSAVDFFTKNAITYVTPTMGGLTGTIQYGVASSYDVQLGGTSGGANSVMPSIKADGSKYSNLAGSLTFANGPLTGGVGYQAVNNGSGALDHSFTNWRVGYTFGALTVAAGSQQYRQGDAASSTFYTSATAPAASTSNIISAGYAVNPNLNVGATVINNNIYGTFTNAQARYSLSKRTTVYATASSVSAGTFTTGASFSALDATNASAATSGNSSSGYAFGVIHSF